MYIAQFATGEYDFVDDYYSIVKKENIFNLQLRYWTEARNKFQKLYEDNFILEEAIIIINCLCGSLEALAGVNIIIQPDENTPSLKILYDKTLKEQKVWDLKIEKPDLYRIFEDMDRHHKNICKHLKRSCVRRDMLKEINYKKIEEYMKATKEIWLWILNKANTNNIPENQLKFFNDF
jgi:hypothetical protein